MDASETSGSNQQRPYLGTIVDAGPAYESCSDSESYASSDGLSICSFDGLSEEESDNDLELENNTHLNSFSGMENSSHDQARDEALDEQKDVQQTPEDLYGLGAAHTGYLHPFPIPREYYSVPADVLARNSAPNYPATGAVSMSFPSDPLLSNISAEVRQAAQTDWNTPVYLHSEWPAPPVDDETLNMDKSMDYLLRQSPSDDLHAQQAQIQQAYNEAQRTAAEAKALLADATARQEEFQRAGISMSKARAELEAERKELWKERAELWAEEKRRVKKELKAMTAAQDSAVSEDKPSICSSSQTCDCHIVQETFSKAVDNVIKAVDKSNYRRYPAEDADPEVFSLKINKLEDTFNLRQRLEDANCGCKINAALIAEVDKLGALSQRLTDERIDIRRVSARIAFDQRNADERSWRACVDRISDVLEIMYDDVFYEDEGTRWQDILLDILMEAEDWEGIAQYTEKILLASYFERSSNPTKSKGYNSLENTLLTKPYYNPKRDEPYLKFARAEIHDNMIFSLEMLHVFARYSMWNDEKKDIAECTSLFSVKEIVGDVRLESRTGGNEIVAAASAFLGLVCENCPEFGNGDYWRRRAHKVFPFEDVDSDEEDGDAEVEQREDDVEGEDDEWPKLYPADEWTVYIADFISSRVEEQLDAIDDNRQKSQAVVYQGGEQIKKREEVTTAALKKAPETRGVKSDAKVVRRDGRGEKHDTTTSLKSDNAVKNDHAKRETKLASGSQKGNVRSEESFKMNGSKSKKTRTQSQTTPLNIYSIHDFFTAIQDAFNNPDTNLHVRFMTLFTTIMLLFLFGTAILTSSPTRARSSAELRAAVNFAARSHHTLLHHVQYVEQGNLNILEKFLKLEEDLKRVADAAEDAPEITLKKLEEKAQKTEKEAVKERESEKKDWWDRVVAPAIVRAQQHAKQILHDSAKEKEAESDADRQESSELLAEFSTKLGEMQQMFLDYANNLKSRFLIQQRNHVPVHQDNIEKLSNGLSRITAKIDATTTTVNHIGRGVSALYHELVDRVANIERIAVALFNDRDGHRGVIEKIKRDVEDIKMSRARVN